MKELIYTSPGGLEVIKVRDAEVPKPRAGEAVVKVEMGSVNHVDIWGRQNLPYQPFPRRFGSDAAGYIYDPGDTGLKEGERVVLYPMDFCGRCRSCLSGLENSCFSRKLYGVHEDGFFAEYVSVPARNIIPLPDNVSYEHAAALPVAYLTAWHGLVTRASGRPGETLLILGGSGGVGVAALQIGRMLGMQVYTTTSSKWKAEQLMKLGAKGVIGLGEGLQEEALKASGGSGFDVVFDALGGDYFPIAVKLAKRGGRVINMAMTAGPTAQINLRDIYSNNITVHGLYLGTRKELADMLSAISFGYFKPIIDSVYPFYEVDKAQKRMEERAHLGKIMLKF